MFTLFSLGDTSQGCVSVDNLEAVLIDVTVVIILCTELNTKPHNLVRMYSTGPYILFPPYASHWALPTYDDNQCISLISFDTTQYHRNHNAVTLYPHPSRDRVV